MSIDHDELIPILEGFLATMEAEVELSRMRERRHREMAEAHRQMAEALGRAAESLKPDSPGPMPHAPP
jgi:hypothetical protein